MKKKPEENEMHIYIGGSFDPIHLGHMAMANMVHQTCLQLGVPYHIYFLPTAGSPFKLTQTTLEHRLDMVHKAMQDMVKDQKNLQKVLSVDTRELSQTPPVFSIDTFLNIRKEMSTDRVVFVIGKDSLQSLPTWKKGFELLSVCHLWVFDRVAEQTNHSSSCRSSENLSNLVPKEVLSSVCYSPSDLLNHSFGRIFLDNRQPPAISSSQIRNALASGCHINDIKNLLCLEVWKYIKHEGLYC